MGATGKPGDSLVNEQEGRVIQAIGLVDEVAEGARQGQGFGGEGAGGRLGS